MKTEDQDKGHLTTVPGPAPTVSEAQQLVVGMKDHQIAQTVNALTSIARDYRDTEQLRERIAHVIRPLLKGEGFPKSIVNAYAMPVAPSPATGKEEMEHHLRGVVHSMLTARPEGLETRFDPMVNPMRPSYYIGNADDETPAEQVLRKLAAWLGVGGYNAPTVDAKVFHEKIVWAIENLFVPKSIPESAAKASSEAAGDARHDLECGWKWVVNPEAFNGEPVPGKLFSGLDERGTSRCLKVKPWGYFHDGFRWSEFEENRGGWKIIGSIAPMPISGAAGPLGEPEILGSPTDSQDAKRYRWLRSFKHCNAAWCFIGGGDAEAALDASIDAAMSANTTKETE